jgi:hypothetical protein
MKTNKNAVRTVGRPAAVINYPRGIFTMKDLFNLNKDVCALTCIKHVQSDLDTKTLTLLKDTIKTGKVGKPAFRYIRTAVAKGLKSARKARKTDTVAIPVDATPAPAPVAVVADVSVVADSVPAPVAVIAVEAPAELTTVVVA